MRCAYLWRAMRVMYVSTAMSDVDRTREPPVRLCCWERHIGVQCPDGLVMCCLCFSRFSIDDLAVEDGTTTNVCQKCHDEDLKQQNQHNVGR